MSSEEEEEKIKVLLSQLRKAFSTLGIVETNSKGNALNKYKKLSLQFHPDKATLAIGIGVEHPKFANISGVYTNIFKKIGDAGGFVKSIPDDMWTSYIQLVRLNNGALPASKVSNHERMIKNLTAGLKNEVNAARAKAKANANANAARNRAAKNAKALYKSIVRTVLSIQNRDLVIVNNLRSRAQDVLCGETNMKKNMAEYCRRVREKRNPWEWAGEIEIHALSFVLQHAIFVYEKGEDGKYMMVDIAGVNFGRPIHLLYDGINQYQLFDTPPKAENISNIPPEAAPYIIGQRANNGRSPNPNPNNGRRQPNPNPNNGRSPNPNPNNGRSPNPNPNNGRSPNPKPNNGQSPNPNPNNGRRQPNPNPNNGQSTNNQPNNGTNNQSNANVPFNTTYGISGAKIVQNNLRRANKPNANVPFNTTYGISGAKIVQNNLRRPPFNAAYGMSRNNIVQNNLRPQKKANNKNTSYGIPGAKIVQNNLRRANNRPSMPYEKRKNNIVQNNLRIPKTKKSLFQSIADFFRGSHRVPKIDPRFFGRPIVDGLWEHAGNERYMIRIVPTKRAMIAEMNFSKMVGKNTAKIVDVFRHERGSYAIVMERVQFKKQMTCADVQKLDAIVKSMHASGIAHYCLDGNHVGYLRGNIVVIGFEHAVALKEPVTLKIHNRIMRRDSKPLSDFKVVYLLHGIMCR